MKRLDEVPLVPEDEPGDPLWYPLQHHFGFTAFGVNVYTATEALGDAIRARVRDVLLVQTSVELVPWGSLARSEYKSTLVERG